MKRYLPFVIIVAVLAGAVVLVVALSRKRPDAGTAKAEPTGVNQPAGPASSAEPPIVRPNVKVKSPVVLEEFGDYQCPPCGLLYPELRKLEGEYGDQLRVVFHHFPLTNMHKNALIAAQAAEAARNQNKFWEMHDRLYLTQKNWSEDGNARSIFISYAKELGLNVDRFTSDIDSPEVAQRIAMDFQQGNARHVTGTPTVFIDGQMLLYERTNSEGLRRGINLMLQEHVSREHSGN